LPTRANFAELQQKEYIRYEDMALETSDGRRIEVEFVSYLYLVNQQKVIQCNIRDISGRKRAEENIRRMATVVRDSNDAITISDFEGQITAWNRGAELMYGYSEAEGACRMSIWRITPPAKRAEKKSVYRAAACGAKRFPRLRRKRVTKDGRVLDVWLTVTKLMDDAGKPIGIASTERDITARKREAEKCASRASPNSASWLRSLPQLVWTCRGDGPCDYLSPPVGGIHWHSGARAAGVRLVGSTAP